MNRVLVLAASIVWTCSLVSIADTLEEYAPPEKGSVRIIRDNYGVPHIIASDLPSMAFGAGYCQAEDQLENLAMNMLRGQGMSAEQDGLTTLPLDHLVRSLGLPDRSARQYPLLAAEDKLMLDAFVAGVNAYISQHRSEIAAWIQPITPVQVMAFSEYVDVMFSATHCQKDLEKAGIKLAQWNSLPNLQASSIGSNQFAIAPSRTEHGSALLSMDPHLPHTGFFRWYEMHLIGPNVNVMGACFYGLPFIGMGRTDRSAWCMTVNGPDLGDVFEFEKDPNDPSRLKGINGWETFEITQEIHRVKTPSGISEIKLPRQGSPVGPVVTTKDNKAFAFSLPLSESPARFGQMLAMGRARNVTEFRKSLEPLGLVMFNILYADVDGDIFIISNSRSPRRDLRIASNALRPGDQSWARWQGFHSLSELPQVLNPPCGYLLNTNSGAQNVTEDVAPRQVDFPPYMMSQQKNSRFRRLSSLLSADKSINWEEMHEYATDTHLEAADLLLPKILAAIDAHSKELSEQQEVLADVRRVLSNWNRNTDVDSRGAVLFMMILMNSDFQKANSAGDELALANSLLKPAAQVLERFGSLDCPWGEFSRVRRGEIDMGIAGNGTQLPALEQLGVIALRPTTGQIKDGRRYCQGGTSYAMIVDFKSPTRSVSILPYGVSDNPKSPHFTDQLPLYVEGKYKPAWFLPIEISANSKSDIVISAK